MREKLALTYEIHRITIRYCRREKFLNGKYSCENVECHCVETISFPLTFFLCYLCSPGILNFHFVILIQYNKYINNVSCSVPFREKIIGIKIASRCNST